MPRFVPRTWNSGAPGADQAREPGRDPAGLMSGSANQRRSRQRGQLGFLNLAHALDHFVILIYPTVIIELERTFHRSYSDLILLGTASFTAFGLFSLPAGWLAA